MLDSISGQTANFRRRFSGLFALLVVGLLFSTPAAGQVQKQPAVGKKQPAGKQPGAKQPGAKQKQPGAKKPDDAKPVEPPDDAKVAPLRLQNIPSMRIDDPVKGFTNRRYEELRVSLAKIRYKSALAKGELSDQQILDWADWRIYGLSLKENRPNLTSLRDDTLAELNKSGSLHLGEAASRRYRTKICEAVTERCAKLLDRHYYTRINAVIILSRMNLQDFDLRAGTPPEAYGPAADPLMTVLKDKDQHISIRILAATGLKRIGQLAKLERARARNIGQTLVDQFKQKDLHPWYQSILAEAMGNVDLAQMPNGDAILVQTLTEGMVNKDLSPRVRSECAKALGRAAMPNDVNLKLLSFEIVKLSREMADLYNAEIEAAKNAKPGGNRPQVAPHWPRSFLNLFYAFQPVEPRTEPKLYVRRIAAADRRPGLLVKFGNRPEVDAAYKQVKPVVSHVLKSSTVQRGAANAVNHTPVPADIVADLQGWLASNRPESFRVQPSMPPIRTVTAASAASVGRDAVNGVAP